MDARVEYPPEYPHNIEAEQALLGALLVNNEVFDQLPDTFGAEHFYEPLHSHIFERARVRHRSGQKASPVTLAHEFAADEAMAEIGGTAYLARLAAASVTILTAGGYADTVLQLAIRRELIAYAEDLTRDARDFPVSGEIMPVIADVVDRLTEFSDRASGRGRTLFRADEVAGRLVADLHEPGRDGPTGIATGIAALDRLTGGLKRKEFYILAGRPGMGKSCVGPAILTRAALGGHGGAYFSLEMGEDAIAQRIVADLAWNAAAPIEYNRIDRGDIGCEELARIERASERLRGIALHIETAPGLTCGQIEARARMLKRAMERDGGSLDIVAIDYLQLVRAGNRYAGNRYAEVTEISAALREMAKRLDVAVLALCQLSREVERRCDRRPILADLRDSGALEQDADAVFFVYREDYYLGAEAPRDDDAAEADRIAALERARNRMELIVAKQRRGPTKTVGLFCDIGCNVVRDLHE